jgi:hypothetical protein
MKAIEKLFSTTCHLRSFASIGGFIFFSSVFRRARRAVVVDLSVFLGALGVLGGSIL